MPTLQPENVLPLHIYTMVRQQVIIGMSGVVDHDQSAIWRWIDELEIDKQDRVFCFDLVYAACREYQRHIKELQEEKQGNRGNTW